MAARLGVMIPLPGLMIREPFATVPIVKVPPTGTTVIE